MTDTKKKKRKEKLVLQETLSHTRRPLQYKRRKRKIGITQ